MLNAQGHPAKQLRFGNASIAAPYANWKQSKETAESPRFINAWPTFMILPKSTEEGGTVLTAMVADAVLLYLDPPTAS